MILPFWLIGALATSCMDFLPYFLDLSSLKKVDDEGRKGSFRFLGGVPSGLPFLRIGNCVVSDRIGSEVVPGLEYNIQNRFKKTQHTIAAPTITVSRKMTQSFNTVAFTGMESVMAVSKVTVAVDIVYGEWANHSG